MPFRSCLAPCLATIAALSVTGCSAASDPAKEEKVDMKPGSYEVSVGANGIPAGFFENAPGGKPTKICLGTSQLRDNGRGVVAKLFDFGSSCHTDKYDRQGNAISGTIKCPTDPSKAPGSLNIDFTGRVAAESLELDSELKMDIDLGNMPAEQRQRLEEATKTMEDINMSVSLKRVGDC